MNLNRRTFLSVLGISPLSVNLFGQIENSFTFGKPFKTLYKVTNCNGFSTACIPSALKINYEASPFVSKPKDFGPLFTFENLNDAFEYSYSSLGSKLFRCRSKQYQKGFMVNGSVNASIRQLIHFWKNPVEHSNRLYSFIDDSKSYSVIFCDTLEILERIR